MVLLCLQVQNRIDDIAMAFERLHAMVTGQDPLATALFFWRCLLLATGKAGAFGGHDTVLACAELLPCPMPTLSKYKHVVMGKSPAVSGSRLPCVYCMLTRIAVCICRCVAGCLPALWLLGPGPLLFVWWCWEVLRPPSWRKPPGVKGPVQFVINLPSRSLEEG